MNVTAAANEAYIYGCGGDIPVTENVAYTQDVLMFIWLTKQSHQFWCCDLCVLLMSLFAGLAPMQGSESFNEVAWWPSG